MEESLGTKVTEAEIIQIQSEMKKHDLSITDSGEIDSSTISELALSVKAYRKAGLIPKHLETDAQAVGAILYCKQIGVPPLTGIGQVACIHGKFSAFGSLFISLAQRDPDFGYDEIFFLDENQDRICSEKKNLNAPAWACVVRTQKKGSPFTNEFFFTMDDAKDAGIIRNVWKTYPKDMLRWKAMSRAYRSTYPAALNGVLLAEDLQDWQPTEKDVSTQVNLNNL